MPLELKKVRSKKSFRDPLFNEWEGLWSEYFVIVTNDEVEAKREWATDGYDTVDLANGVRIYQVKPSKLRDNIEGDDGIYEWMEWMSARDRFVRYIGQTASGSNASLADRIASHTRGGRDTSAVGNKLECIFEVDSERKSLRVRVLRLDSVDHDKYTTALSMEKAVMAEFFYDFNERNNARYKRCQRQAAQQGN